MKPSCSCATTALVSTWSMRISCLACSSACIVRRNSKARALASPMCAASFNVTAAAPGPKAKWIRARRFIFHCPKQNYPMSPLKRILLAEDNKNDVELTLAALEEYNLANEVVIAHDGVEVLDYLFRRGSFANHANGIPAVILLDLKMPRMDGLEALRQLREEPRFRHVPVVMITSSREEQDLVRSYELGVNAYVVKPVDFQKFVECIKQIGFFWALINEPPPIQKGQKERP